MYPGFPFSPPPKVNVPPPKPTTRPDGTPLYEYRLWSYNGLLDDAAGTCPYELGDPRPCTYYEEAKECTDDDCEVGRQLEFGHGHPIEGCWVRQLIEAIGWGDAISWRPVGAVDISLPADVSVCCDEDGCELSQWVQP